MALAGICGGVAAYKAVEVVSALRKQGVDITVAMSDAAQAFVTPLTFSAVSGRAALTSVMPPSGAAGDALYPHLYPATRADLFVLMPATADMIGHIVHGLGRDVVSTSALSLKPDCLRVFCPAMNVDMWNQPIVQQNVRELERRGWIRVGPETGLLACGVEGQGRMAEPATILGAIRELRGRAGRLAGWRVLVLSGPTHEHLDPVRFIGNPSSGKMGRALAEAASRAGAEVDVVTGPVSSENLPVGRAITTHRVTSAQQMLDAARALYAKADIVLYAAAVADYRPAEYSDAKRPKQSGEVTLRLVATPDIAATLAEGKRPGQITIGFALQTGDGRAEAEGKLVRKKFDGIVLNGLDSLGGDDGSYTWIAHGGDAVEAEAWGAMSKVACAARIVDAAAALLGR